MQLSGDRTPAKALREVADRVRNAVAAVRPSWLVYLDHSAMFASLARPHTSNHISHALVLIMCVHEETCARTRSLNLYSRPEGRCVCVSLQLPTLTPGGSLSKSRAAMEQTLAAARVGG
jgi:hypothetical protein